MKGEQMTTANINQEVTTNIIQVLAVFQQQEFGNRLSEFAMLALTQSITNELKKLEIQTPVKESLPSEGPNAVSS